MICQACGKRNATTHVKTIVNGKLTQYHLCSECAAKQGFNSLLGGWNFSFGNLLSGLMGGAETDSEVQRCKKCGTSFEEIAKTGKIGCAECYNTFRHQLLPVIQRIHGTALHKGKRPGSSAMCVSEGPSQIVAVQSTELDEKKRLLQKAIEEQEFERAAVLRDEIKEMENHV